MNRHSRNLPIRAGLVSTRRVIALAVLLLAALLLIGCASEPPAPKVDEAALLAEAEERRKAEEEAQRVAEERRKAEEERQRREAMELFGPVGEPPPSPAAKAEAAAVAQKEAVQAAGVPFDEAVPALPADPTVRVAVLAHGVDAATVRDVALIIGTTERQRLEDRLGMAVKIAYVAQTRRPPARPSEIHYRESFLRAAQSVAEVLTAEQWIGPMSPDEARQDTVDLYVYIGSNYP